MVDKLNNTNAEAARKDKIDFDLPQFQLFCLEGNKGAKFDNKEILRQRRKLTRPQLYKKYLDRKTVEARTIKPIPGPQDLKRVDDLMAPEKSSIPLHTHLTKFRPKKSSSTVARKKEKERRKVKDGDEEDGYGSEVSEDSEEVSEEEEEGEEGEED